jgi:hypothetical protein
MSVAILALALALATLAACGQTPMAGPPETLTNTISTLGSSATRTFTVRDVPTVQRIYQHVLSLAVIPPQAGPACRVTRQSYHFAFMASSSAILTAAIVQCANILQMPNNVSRAPDAAFWSMLDSATGQRIEPD